MIIAEHTWVPTLPEWVVELQPILVFLGLTAGVGVLWLTMLAIFEPRKRWRQFRHKDVTITGLPSERELAEGIDKQLALRHKEEEE